MPNPRLLPYSQSSGPISAGVSNSRAKPTASGPNNGSTYSMPPRPLSPIKMLQQQNPPPILKTTTTPGLNSRAQLSPAPPITSSTALGSRKRVSIDSNPKSSRGHARAGSIPSIDSGRNSPRVSISSPKHMPDSSSPPGTPTFTQPIMTMASILQVAEELDDENEDSIPEIQSPSKSTHSSDPARELVANARRERKVQDLEITNASLEAINRTLERQLRKQTAEIRRYRRLSRSGHISLTSPESDRVPSQTLTDAPIDLTELSEEEEDESMLSEEEEPDSLDDSELSSAESVSGADLPESELDNADKKGKTDGDDKDDKASTRRKRDERRLRLDLTKHRELLVDSQKINQSLKRCLNWTEILIREGQKALEYKVKVSDVQFGGHVLAPPDEEDDVQLDIQLLESLEADSGPSPAWEKSSQDRDSGIELQPEVV
ncbi:hypothetical protein BGZ63DRAFT_30917 [Mariannaea sp. PMI_226]|nr:hypothetical protein BGZ63DRAFT_30917 [Mariannaea sp. PMI_226]